MYRYIKGDQTFFQVEGKAISEVVNLRYRQIFLGLVILHVSRFSIRIPKCTVVVMYDAETFDHI